MDFAVRVLGPVLLALMVLAIRNRTKRMTWDEPGDLVWRPIFLTYVNSVPYGTRV
ncbi:hypothetical protein GORHZ_006_00320 [Gordonia rhizosphera NBRC 16068]|uniref:Uncharacterized protein n=1 Tax=Gordonia rhizosphera NBRC 16068 TaxID=1108045 RepID=K6UXN9_9ACTN|nr:hypothetical protein GORHZ_006_00320 [Gordonia rhizosphera NBRC 16068]